MKRGPWLYVTADDRRRILLLRGDGVEDVVLALGLEARYSRAGHGRVVDHRHLPDVVAFCEFRHELVVVSDRKPPDTAGAA